MILRMLGRVVMVPLGLLLASMTALGVMFTLGLELATHTLASYPDNLDKFEVLLELGLGLLSFAAVASIIPSLLVIVVGEIAGIRSALYYIVGGGIAVALLPLLARVATAEAGGAVPARVWTALATAGFAGGLVYWLVAGRRA